MSRLDLPCLLVRRGVYCSTTDAKCGCDAFINVQFIYQHFCPHPPWEVPHTCYGISWEWFPIHHLLWEATSLIDQGTATHSPARLALLSKAIQCFQDGVSAGSALCIYKEPSTCISSEFDHSPFCTTAKWEGGIHFRRYLQGNLLNCPAMQNH